MRYLRRLAGMLRPWPSRTQRRAAITAARDQKERSRASARHAHAIERDIARMAEANHFAAAIADQIVRRGH